MSDYGNIKPTDLDEETKLRHEKFMADSFVLLGKCAKERGMGVKELRNEFKAGRCVLTHSPRAKGVMLDMIALEETVVAAWIKMLHTLIVSFDNVGQTQRPGVTFLDYVQEAAWGIYDAQYTFTGSDRFSTYAYWCAKNRLISFVRQEERTSGISQAVKRIRLQVRHLMNTYHLSFEDAISRLQAEDESITSDVIEKVRDALYQMKSSDETVGGDAWNTRHHNRNGKDDLEAMREAVRLADMTPLERALINAHLSNDRRFRTELLERATKIAARMLRDQLVGLRGNRSFVDTAAELQASRGVTFPKDILMMAIKGPGPMLNDPLAADLVNPQTFKPISKQRVSHYFTRACEKARAVYEGVESDAKTEAA